MPKFIRIATILHVDTSNSEIFFQYVQILTFLKNSPSNLKFSYILRLSPLCMSIGKWQKPWEIKLLLRVILEQCVFCCLFTTSSVKLFVVNVQIFGYNCVFQKKEKGGKENNFFLWKYSVGLNKNNICLFFPPLERQTNRIFHTVQE